MLQTISLRDFVIVDQLELDFASGFTVLTGETGAGKSILLDALSLVLGERADSSQIREGSHRAEICAQFRIDPELLDSFNQWLDEQGFPIEDDGRSLLLKRTIESNGRSRAFINGSTATLAQLREAGDQLVDIHGQHAHQLLLKSGAQRELLDRHAGLLPLANEVAQAFKALNDSRRLLEQAENAGQDIERERERLPAEPLRRIEVARDVGDLDLPQRGDPPRLRVAEPLRLHQGLDARAARARSRCASSARRRTQRSWPRSWRDTRRWSGSVTRASHPTRIAQWRTGSSADDGAACSPSSRAPRRASTRSTRCARSRSPIEGWRMVLNGWKRFRRKKREDSSECALDSVSPV